jgi:hypothetical protein
MKPGEAEADSLRNDSKKSNGNGKSRLPAGMTARKAKAKADLPS